MTTDAVLLAKIDALTKTVEQRDGALKTAHLTIDKLNLELSYLKRMRYGRASEKLDHEGQLELMNSTLAPAANEPVQSKVTDIEVGRSSRKAEARSALRELPEHLPRNIVMHDQQGG